MLVFMTLFIAALLAVLDQLLKILAALTLQNVDHITVIDGLLEWTYRENTGAAFSMLSDNRNIFLVTTTVLLVLCVFLLLYRFSDKPYWCFVIALLLGGGLGNMIDRVALGYVVDYIHVLFFPAVFNFADICVTVGAALFALPLLIDLVRDTAEGIKNPKKKQDTEPEQTEEPVQTESPEQ